MSIMTENKARRLLKDYMDAELEGADTRADEIEKKLNEAGWKISVGTEGYTVIRKDGGLFSQDSTANTVLLPLEQYVAPYTGNVGRRTGNTPLVIGISIGVVIFIIVIVLAIKAIKKNTNVAAT